MSYHCMESGGDTSVCWPIIFGPRKHRELGKILVLGAKYWLGPAGRVGWWRVLRGHNDSIGGESQKSRSSSIYYILPAPCCSMVASLGAQSSAIHWMEQHIVQWISVFLDTHVSLAPTHVCLSVRPSVRPLVILLNFHCPWTFLCCATVVFDVN